MKNLPSSGTRKLSSPNSPVAPGMSRRLAAIGLGVILLIAAAVWLLLRMMSPRPATALEIDSIVKAFADHKVRHRFTTLTSNQGKTKLSEELWTDGVRFRYVKEESPGVSLIEGFDGSEGFVKPHLSRGYIEDRAAMPRDHIPGMTNGTKNLWMKSRTSVRRNDRLLDLYTQDFNGAKYCCYVDPGTFLPLEWTVKSEDDQPVEERIYEYPDVISDSIFAIPRQGPLAPIDYPALRAKVATQLKTEGPQTWRSARYQVTLWALIVAHNQLIVLYTDNGLDKNLTGISFPGVDDSWHRPDPNVDSISVTRLKAPPIPLTEQGLGLEVLLGPAQKPRLGTSIDLDLDVKRYKPLTIGKQALPLSARAREIVGKIRFHVERPLVLDEPFSWTY